MAVNQEAVTYIVDQLKQRLIREKLRLDTEMVAAKEVANERQKRAESLYVSAASRAHKKVINLVHQLTPKVKLAAKLDWAKDLPALEIRGDVDPVIQAGLEYLLGDGRNAITARNRVRGGDRALAEADIIDVEIVIPWACTTKVLKTAMTLLAKAKEDLETIRTRRERVKYHLSSTASLVQLHLSRKQYLDCDLVDVALTIIEACMEEVLSKPTK